MSGLRLFLMMLILLVKIPPVVFAGNTLSFHQHIQIETSRKLKTADQKIIKKYLDNKDYRYGSNPRPPKGYGFLENILRVILKWIASGLRVINMIPWVFRILLIAGVIMLIYFIIAKTTLQKIVYRDEKIPMPDFLEIDLNLDSLDIDRTINLEISRQNFRNAIRLMHLKILKLLEEQGLIKISKDKTNRDYSYEIKDAEIKNRFLFITDIYNRVWYGKYLVSGNEFAVMQGSFNAFYNKTAHGKE